MKREMGERLAKTKAALDALAPEQRVAMEVGGRAPPSSPSPFQAVCCHPVSSRSAACAPWDRRPCRAVTPY